MKLPKLNLICSNDALRPIMSYVFINNTDVVATNGHVLAMLDKQEVFGNALKDVNNVLIGKDNWKLFTKDYEDILVDMQAKQIFIRRKNGLFDICSYIHENSVGKFPNHEAIFPTKSNGQAVEKIGLNPFLLQNLAMALSVEKTNLELRFYGEEKQIVVIPVVNNFNAKGIIMPISINK